LLFSPKNFSFKLMFVDPCIIVQQFIHKNPTRCNSISKLIIPYLCEAQHVTGETPPIIRSLKLRQQPLVLHTWKVVGRVVAGRRQRPAVQQLHVQQPSMYAKPEAAGAVLGS
jgi:hypothetical protein